LPSLNLISSKGLAVLVLGRSVVVIFTCDLASAGIMEMNILAAFARFEKGLNFAVMSVRYLVIMMINCRVLYWISNLRMAKK